MKKKFFCFMNFLLLQDPFYILHRTISPILHQRNEIALIMQFCVYRFLSKEYIFPQKKLLNSIEIEQLTYFRPFGSCADVGSNHCGKSLHLLRLIRMEQHIHRRSNLDMFRNFLHQAQDRHKLCLQSTKLDIAEKNQNIFFN